MLLTVASASAWAKPQSTTVDFSSGTQGWLALASDDGTGSVIDNSTGNGTPGLHMNYYFTGAMFWNQSNQSFLGDYTTSKSVSLGIDVNTHSIDSGGDDDGGAQYPRDFLVELRQYTTPGDASKYFSVWHMLGALDKNTGPLHFSATLADTGAAELASGWQVYDSATDGDTLPAGTTLRDVLSRIDEVQFDTRVPGYSYDPAHYDVTVDNISIKSAVPEPEQLAMLLAGLGVVGVVARRRRPVAATA
ncbi:PEP-CTERM sorting domain-containing protein [Rugamonas sp.]|uniref:PEP-CTERM sorting domain-containing protein n=1 Tax=Rugamonas sp. TaxID=1926287 RepID=UPI0025FB7815|nr:PEP-CTERM sorting domain-containing protein [Rugamonas sp.]